MESKSHVDKKGYHGGYKGDGGYHLTTESMGDFTAYQNFLKWGKDRISEECSTENIEQVAEIGGKLPEIPPTPPLKVYNKLAMEMEEKKILDREAKIAEDSLKYREDWEEYGAYMEAKQQFEEEGKSAAEIEAIIGPPMEEPAEVVVEPLAQVEHEWTYQCDRNTHSAQVRIRENNIEKLKVEKGKIMTIFHSGLSSNYRREVEQTTWWKEIEKQKDVVEFLNKLLHFHLSRGQKNPILAYDTMREKLYTMKQHEFEALAHWLERLVDTNAATGIIANECGVTTTALTDVEVARRFILGLNQDYSKFKDGYVRGDKEFPKTIADAHTAADKFGKDTLASKSKVAGHQRVYTAKVEDKKDQVCGFCKGRYHNEGECRFKAQGMTTDQAVAEREKRYRARRAKWEPKK